MTEPSIINTPPAGDPPAGDPPTLTAEEQKVADDKAADDKAAADKAADDKAAADKVIADKAAADKTAALTPEEQKAADDKAAADKKEAEDKEKAQHAPEKYEDFKLPEGMEMDTAALEKFTPLAKEANLSQEMAQKFIDLRVESVQEESKRQWDVWETTQKDWVADSKSDKEIGGEKFEENLGIAKKAMDAYGNDALKDLAEATGMGNHKEFIRFMKKVGDDITEDKLRVSGAQTKEGSRAARIYDKTEPPTS